MRSSAHTVQVIRLGSSVDHAIRKRLMYHPPVTRDSYFTQLLQGNSIPSQAEPMAHGFFILATASGRLHISGAQINTCTGIYMILCLKEFEELPLTL